MKLTASFLSIVIFYAICAFVSLEINPLLWPEDGRVLFSALALVFFGATYSYPGWKD